MVRWVEVLLTIIRAMPLLMLQDHISIRRIRITRVGILSILKGIRCILPFQLVDLSGIREDSPSKLRLLPVVQDLQGNLVSQVRGEVYRGEVIKLIEVVGDDNKPKDVLTISLCRMLRIIRT
ncbi:hypothetical protein ACFXTO_025924 [Malus domestica]